MNGCGDDDEESESPYFRLRATNHPSFPRKRGRRVRRWLRYCPGTALAQQVFVKVAPLRVLALDQFELPRAAPFLDPLFAQDCFRHGFVKLGKDQFRNVMISGEPIDLADPMFPNAPREIARYPDIERPISPARQDVHARTAVRHLVSSSPWAPAFAGAAMKRIPARHPFSDTSKTVR